MDMRLDFLASDPVSLSSGELINSDIDLILPGLVPCVVNRFFRSGGADFGPLGLARTCGLDVTIRRKSTGLWSDLIYRNEAGLRIFFYQPTPGAGLWERNAKFKHLGLAAGENRTLVLHDGPVFKHFGKYPDNIWRLIRIEDRNGNVLAFTRTEDGILQAIQQPDGLGLVFDNDARGLRTGMTLVGLDDTRRRMASYDYDLRGNMIAARLTYGPSRTYVYDAHDNLVSWSENGRTEGRHDYDAGRRVVLNRTNGSFDGDAFEYDAAARVTRFLPGGRAEAAVASHFDENGLLIREERPLGGVDETTYEDGYATCVTDALGHETRYTYDRYGNIASVTDAEGRQRQYYWNEDGAPTISIDPDGNSWMRSYDRKGNLTQIINPDQYGIEISNNARGLPVGAMRSDGMMESRAYDAHHNLMAVRDFRGELMRFERDGFGRVTAVTDALGGVTQLAYEERPGSDFWSPSGLTRPDGVKIIRQSEAGGSKIVVIDGEGRATEYIHGPFDLLTELRDPKGGILQFSYDGQQKLAAVTNQQGLRWVFERDAAGRVVYERDFGGLVLEYTYDKADRLIEMRYADNTRLVFTYDKSGLLIAEEAFSADDTLTERTLFFYDANGQLKMAQNRSAIVEFQRDKQGRIICENLNGREVKSGYDCCGNRVTREIGGRLIETAYDPLGAIKSLTIVAHEPLIFKRDALGRELSRESALGFRLEQVYDPVGQLLKQVAGFSMTALGTGIEGAMAAQHLGIDPQKATRQVERAYAWTKAFEPLTIGDKRWGNTAYTYDANGQIEQASFGDGYAERFSYDAALNIAGFGEGPGPERKAFIGSGAAGASYVPPIDKGKFEAWQSSAGGRVNEARGPNGERVYLIYDLRGRVTERRVERSGFRSRTWRYTWDAKDRLTGCMTPEQERWTYGYDPFGRRVSKVNATKAQLAAKAAGTRLPDEELLGAFYEDKRLPKEQDQGLRTPIGVAYHWDGHNLAEEAPLILDGTALWDAATRWHYEPNSFRPLAKETPDGKLLYIVTDHLGTPREMFSEEGTLQWAAEYRTWGGVRKLWRADPDNDNLPLRENAKPKGIRNLSGNKISRSTGISYGNLALKDDPVWQEATLQCPIRFQGQWEDAETGLYYNRFRYYDPIAAQYVSPDPTGLTGGFSAHNYIACPLVWVDPFGLSGRNEPIPWIPLGNSKEGWQHIDERHISGTSPKGPGELFPSGTTLADIEKLCKCLVKNGQRLTDPNKSIQVYQDRLTFKGMRAQFKAVVDSLNKNRVITIFPALSE